MTKCLLYCTKAKPYLADTKTERERYYCHNTEKGSWGNVLNGTIVAECEVESEEIVYEGVCENPISIFKACRTKTLDCYDLNEKSRLNINNKELEHYLMPDLDENNDDKYFLNVVGYDCHIHNLKPFDRPLELGNVWVKKGGKFGKEGYATWEEPLTKAPQNMCWVWYKGEKYLWLPCSPKECANVLNNKASTLIRKKILKGM